MRRMAILFPILVTALARAAAAQTDTLAPGTLLHLPSRDSIEYIKSGPMYLATGERGLLFAFHPFFATEDTVKLRSVAGEVWTWLRAQVDSTRPSFVVLQATTARAQPTFG